MKQRLYIAVRDRAAKTADLAAQAVSRTRKALTTSAFVAGGLLVTAASFAQSTAPSGTSPGGTQTYALGQAGSPAATDYFGAAQGVNASLAPLLTAILPVLVVILAIWQGPKLLKRLTTMMAH